MSADAAGLNIVNNEAASTFEAKMNDDMALLQYRIDGSQMIFIHTEVPPAFEGKGIGGKLARTGLEYAKAKGFSVVPRCPFIASYIERHPEYAGLVKGWH